MMTLNDLRILLDVASGEIPIVIDDPSGEFDLELKDVRYDGRGPRIIISIEVRRRKK